MLLYLFRVSLWFLLRDVQYYVLPCSLFSYFSTLVSLGEDKAGLYASCAFVCLSCMHLLPLGISVWPRLIIVALLGLVFFIQFHGIGEKSCAGDP